MSKKPTKKAEVLRLWKGGEREKAVRMANEAKLKDDDRPEGMADHVDGMRQR